jgi:predicted peptidase
MYLKYKTFTEVFDWGPAINKIEITFPKLIDIKQFNANDFSIELVRMGKLFIREIDDLKPINSSTLAIKLKVAPDIIESSPFNYNLKTGFNSFIDSDYTIKFNYNETTEILDKSNFDGNINLIADDFENNIPFNYSDISLLYASYTPKLSVKTDDPSPLIIWLHGAGEGGKNTLLTTMGNRVVNLAKKNIQELFGQNGAYILVPQTPTFWMDFTGKLEYNTTDPENRGTSFYTEALMELIKTYINNNPLIDRDRIYIGGCSNGGYMTINLLTAYPNFFTGAFPSATPYLKEWLTDMKIDILKDVPIWLTHAKNDDVIKLNGNIHSNLLYKCLKDAGSKEIYYSLYDSVVDSYSGIELNGHLSWVYVLNNQPTKIINNKELSLFEWLAKQ